MTLEKSSTPFLCVVELEERGGSGFCPGRAGMSAADTSILEQASKALTDDKYYVNQRWRRCDKIGSNKLWK